MSLHFCLTFQCDLLCGYEYIPQLTITLQFVGLAFGCCLFGQLSDSYGRKWTGISALSCLAAADMLVALSPNWIMFSLFRAMVGFFAGKSRCGRSNL